MSKIAEQKALEAYPEDLRVLPFGVNPQDINVNKRTYYQKGYDQALIDIEKQVEESVIEKSNGEVTIEDLVAYNQGFKTGRELAMQDFLEKAEKYLEPTFKSIAGYNCGGDLMNDFKNYMQNEM